MKTKVRMSLVRVAMVASAIAAVGPAGARAADKTVAFDWGMGVLVNQARDTFATPSRIVGESYVECARPFPNTDTGSCYDVRGLGAGGALFTVFPQNYGHFHANFDDPTITCLDSRSGGFGRSVAGVCKPADWGNEPRHITSHESDQWIEIAFKYGGNYQPFSLKTITIGSQPIQLWYETTGGQYFVWSSLGPNAVMSVPTGPIIAAWVSGASKLPYTIWDFVATPGP